MTKPPATITDTGHEGIGSSRGTVRAYNPAVGTWTPMSDVAFFKANIAWLVQCYGHCLSRNTAPVTGPEFARLIGEVYDLKEGHNHFAATFAGKLQGHFAVTSCKITYEQHT